jgi:hypothetical protein
MINYPPAERAAIVLSYDRHIAFIMESLRSRLEVARHTTNPRKIILLQTFQDCEKRQLSGILNERLALCEQLYKGKTR